MHSLDLLSFLFDLFFSGGLRTKTETLPQISLDAMIKKSKLIVIGRVFRIKDPIFHRMAVATIKIEQFIVGNYEGKHIDVTYYPRSSIEARLLLNQRCIFFIDQRNFIANGYAGKIPIEDDNVEIRYILGEATSQTLKDFTQRIRDSRSRQEPVTDKSDSG